MEDFLPVKELDENDLIIARFNTPFADFLCESPDGKPKDVLRISFITHINLPTELSQFIHDNSSQQIPTELLSDLLSTVGHQVQQNRQAETASL
jgi:hypothetical protein